ncbi:hypothetical protein BH11PSE11_BH11PSE11_12700 [soil metagenome]
MKTNRFTFKLTYVALLALGCSMVLPSHQTVAAITDLANIPLVNATTATVLPNILFILDDSGSMADVNLPDDASTGGFWDSKHCNGLAYDSTKTYTPPINYDGTFKPAATYTSAWNDGYNTGNGSTDLSASPKYFYTYTGTELDLDFTYDAAGNALTSTNFYKECNSGLLTTTISLTGAGGNPNTVISSIKVNSVEIMAAASTGANSLDAVGPNVAAKISQNGYRASYNSSTDKITITTANPGAAGKTPVITKTSGTSVTLTPSAFPAATTAPGVGKFTEGLITTAAEKQNYANWWSYYHTRILMAKTSIGLAFQDVRGWPVDTVTDPTDVDHFHARVGFTTISHNTDTASAKYLKIDDFNSTINTVAPHTNNNQKQNFYTKLYAQGASGSTPLRGALSKAGRLYAGKLSSAVNGDPIQYSCQKNYTILMTDGYWNTASESSTYKNLDMSGTGMGGSPIGDVDSGNVADKPSYDGSFSSGSLADIAYYYYHTDLRPGVCAVCTNNVPRSGSDANSKTEDVATHQHMTTFTIGLGLNGRLRYDPNYKSQTSGDYFDILNGLNGKKWPDPLTSSASNSVIERIDDLWHAAVNGRGTYLSARNATDLEDGLKKALNSLGTVTGAGAAAGTSSLNPVPGDANAYIAKYNTGTWDGDLVAHPLDLNLASPTYGLPLTNTVLWSAGTKLAARIPAPGASEVAPRVIKTGASPAGLKDFQWASLTASEKTFLDNTKLSQYASWTAPEIAAGTGSNMLNFLRGWYQYEQQEGGAIQKLYRNRRGGPTNARYNLGDITHSQPVYIKKPPYAFTDAGYTEFRTEKGARTGTVYVSSNDGMMHAFNGEFGDEIWAYVPPMVFPNLWRLADEDYANRHVYFVDGPTATADVKIGNDALDKDQWRTVIMASMGKGARGYFAMDVTDPSSPKVLWSFTADPAFSTNPGDPLYSDPNIGYTYGAPLATKLADGTWVAVMTSGYNNIPEVAAYPGGPTFAAADGKGYVFVIDMKTGKKLKTISTGQGSVASPSGLGKINLYVDNFIYDNKSELAYGGDLLGNMWRINLTAGTVSKLFAAGPLQPITTAPEIAKPDGTNKMLYFGTGRYLGQSDLLNVDVQSIYAIKDNDSLGTVSKAALSQLTQTLNAGAITGAASSSSGWYVNFKESGERVAINPLLYAGVLVFSTSIPLDPTNPSASACSTGGHGAIYEIDFGTGNSLVNLALTSPPVGVSGVQFLEGQAQGGVKKINILTGDGNLVTNVLKDSTSLGGGASGSDTTRVLWRELSN